MPTDKNKLIRFQALDRCFSDPQREYFLEDLQEACRKALEDADVLIPDVSRRTIFSDIAEMEANPEFGVEFLPIAASRRGKRRFYRYAVPGFSIWKKDLSEEQLLQLKSILLMLRQFQGLPQYDAIEEIITELEAKYRFRLPDSSGAIAFETNDNQAPSRHLAVLFAHILNKQPISFPYHPFGKEAYPVTMHPYYLKQYNRRWFLFGGLTVEGHFVIGNYALDRIEGDIQVAHIPYRESRVNFEEDYFYDLIGVTNPDIAAEKIRIRFSKDRFPYVESKPLHPSQRIISRQEGLVEIEVKPAKELYQKLLSFGKDAEVLSPAFVRKKMVDILTEACRNYEQEGA